MSGLVTSARTCIALDAVTPSDLLELVQDRFATMWDKRVGWPCLSVSRNGEWTGRESARTCSRSVGPMGE
jgi:hypothetical protein